MQVILIYGSPASGKLTIAKELVKKTGYRLFHNHLIANAASSIFLFGTKEYAELADKLRITLLESALRGNIQGIIMTYAYGVETYQGLSEPQDIRHIMRIVKKHKGQLSFVRLICDQGELLRRVKGTDREELGKVTDPKVLDVLQKKYHVGDQIPFVKSLTIDTTHLSPKKVAACIYETRNF